MSGWWYYRQSNQLILMHQHQSAVMALAAICQAAEMVKNIARFNRTDNQQLHTIIGSLTYVNAQTPLEIYGSLEQLKLGYTTLINQLGNSPDKDLEVTRYIIGSIRLERKLSKRSSTLNQLSERITDLNRQLTHFELLSDKTFLTIADIYAKVISPLGRRIQIIGERQFLSMESNQQKIRAILLSGIRAAVLWRQLGGRRRQLVFNRATLVVTAEQQMQSIQ